MWHAEPNRVLVIRMLRLQSPSGAYTPATMRVAASAALGVLASVIVLLLGGDYLAPLTGWDLGAGVYLVWIWAVIWWLDPHETALHAKRDDPSRVVADAILLTASVVSLVAVGIVLIKAGHSHGTTKNLLVTVGIVSVVIAWSVVHTVFTLRYTRLYYTGQGSGVNFNESEPPRYTDFAYLSFTIGMTFQVSDTDLQTKEIRATALRHALLSYVFGAVIIATTINLIAGLTH
jgi:uncharacterized membrane protein